MDKATPLISVIIPCYNSGLYIAEAVASVKASEAARYEIIIVDDGSTDGHTQSVLALLGQEGCRVVAQPNGGPAAARNTGAKMAQGEYLFFLDSDNKIGSQYLGKAADVMNRMPEVGLVYAAAEFFGDTSNARFETNEFDFDKLLIGNYIDMCALMRKQAWQQVLGFDEARALIGYEDWELWIRLGLTNWKFHFLNEKLFYYRIRSNSLMAEFDERKRSQAVAYVMGKHALILHKRYKYYNRLYSILHKKPLLFFLKIIYSKWIKGTHYLPR